MTSCHGARDRADDRRGGLGGLDLAEFGVRVHLGVRLGEVDIHDIAELLLGKIGDADRRVLAFNAHPRMLSVIFDVIWIHRATSAAITSIR